MKAIKKHKKYDYDDLKRQYFLSEHHEVREFMRSKNIGITQSTGQMTGTVNKKTKGWAAEKQAWLKQVADKAIESMSNDDEVQKMTRNLILGKKEIIKSVLQRVEVNEKNLNMQELKIAMDIVKRELGEPLDFSKIEQTTINYDGADLTIDV